MHSLQEEYRFGEITNHGPWFFPKKYSNWTHPQNFVSNEMLQYCVSAYVGPWHDRFMATRDLKDLKDLKTKKVKNLHSSFYLFKVLENTVMKDPHFQSYQGTDVQRRRRFKSTWLGHPGSSVVCVLQPCKHSSCTIIICLILWILLV